MSIAGSIKTVHILSLNSGKIMRRVLTYFCFWSIGILQFCSLTAQSDSLSGYAGIRELAEKLYGPDPDLLNGQKYNYTYRSAGGDPFFEANGQKASAIQIKGKRYDEQLIRFDIYNQLVILEFTDVSGARGSIVLNNDWIDYFNLGRAHFRKFPDKAGIERFGQAISLDNITCVYFWKKYYQSELKNGNKYYRFSKPVKEAVIIRDGQVFGYKNKKSFLKCFLEKDRKTVKMQMKEHRIQLKKVSDMDMELLMKYINQLPGYGD